MRISRVLYQSSNWLIYLLLVITSVLLQFTDLEFITTEKVYNAFQEQKRIEKYGEGYADEFAEDLEELGYDEGEDSNQGYLWDLLFDFMFVLIESVKYPYVAFFLFIGFELFFEVRNVSFSQFLKITMVGEFVFLIQDGIQQLYLIFFVPERTMTDIIYSKPFSLKSLLGRDFSYPDYVDYVLGYLDLFEFGFVLVLAWGVTYFFRISFNNSLSRTALVYCISQVLIVLMEVFLFEVML